MLFHLKEKEKEAERIICSSALPWKWIGRREKFKGKIIVVQTFILSKFMFSSVSLTMNFEK